MFVTSEVCWSQWLQLLAGAQAEQKSFYRRLRGNAQCVFNDNISGHSSGSWGDCCMSPIPDNSSLSGSCQVWFLNPTARAWTSGIECLSRAVVAPRLMGVLQRVNWTWHAKRSYIDRAWIVLTSGDVTPRGGSNKGNETLYDSPRYIPTSEVNRIRLQTGLCYTSLRRCSSQAWSTVSCRFLALHLLSFIILHQETWDSTGLIWLV